MATLISRFDSIAEKFTRETDEAIERDGYVRGDIIVELVHGSTRPGESVLDFGCGPGRLSLLLARAGFRVRGVDISEAMIAQACALDRSGLDLEFQTIKEAERLKPESCDAIVCSSVIEYVVDPDDLLRQFHTALRAEGVLIISYANGSSLWRKYWMDTGPPNPLSGPHHQVWNWRGFRALLQQSGFRVAGRPIFFESPFDRPLWARFFRHAPFAGSLAVVVARPESKGA
jgi:2-polyprenyl-3-methyl-5-hydroxy-6-metoxy-1,4-benzoquinol methylase